jgi:Mor family transcriptional regulator
MNMKDALYKNTTKDDLAGVYTEVAEQIGLDNTYKLFNHFRGQQISFPLKFYSSSYIADRMREEYDGHNTRELARKYQYSESRVRQILAQKS